MKTSKHNNRKMSASDSFEFNDLLIKNDIDPERVILLRHSPPEPYLRRVLPWLAMERHNLYNAYQETHGKKLERVMSKFVGTGYIASFIEKGSGRALFIGLYRIRSARPITHAEFWEIPEYLELQKTWGMQGFSEEPGRPTTLKFNLELTKHCLTWKGCLVVGWPPPDISWWRYASKNKMPLVAMHEENCIEKEMPEWDQLVLTWDELQSLPAKWKEKLKEWRGIYHIFDKSDGKSYVGAAYGKDNLFGRWSNYAKSGDGGNIHLKSRDPKKFIFSILQRSSPDMDKDGVIEVEQSWKRRLHTKYPHGLNAS